MQCAQAGNLPGPVYTPCFACCGVQHLLHAGLRRLVGAAMMCLKWRKESSALPWHVAAMLLRQ
jgi:hypothetical protein